MSRSNYHNSMQPLHPQNIGRMHIRTVFVAEKIPSVGSRAGDTTLNTIQENDGSLFYAAQKNTITTNFRGHVEEFNKIMKEESFFEQIKPLLVMLKFIGGLPIYQTSEGVRFHICSAAMLYAVVYYLISLPFLIIVIRYMAIHIFEAKDFDEVIFAQIFLTILIPYTICPFFAWVDAPGLAKHMNKWSEFQMFYYSTTNEVLKLNLKKKVLGLALFNSVVAAAPIIAMMYVPPHLELWHVPVYYFDVFLCIFPLQVLWKLSCLSLNIASSNLARCFKEEAKLNCSSDTIANYKLLWLKLSYLTVESGNFFYRSYGVYLLVILWLSTTSLYGCFTCVRVGKYYRLMSFASIALSSVAPLYVICISADEATVNLKASVKNVLHEFDPAQVSVAVWEEVKSFLQAIKLNPSGMSLGGYVTVDKPLFQAATATLVTYLIVLLQFQLGLPEQGIGQNATLMDALL